MYLLWVRRKSSSDFNASHLPGLNRSSFFWVSHCDQVWSGNHLLVSECGTCLEWGFGAYLKIKMSWYLCVFISCLPSKTMCALRERAMSVTSTQIFLPPEQWFACKGCLIGRCYSFARVLVWSLGKQTHAMCCEMVFHFNMSENQL